jgi:hypothetical protein
VASFIRDELLSISGFQEGAVLIRVWHFGRGRLGIWTSNFREGIPLPDLSFGEVRHHLETSFSWAETLAFSSIQQDVPTTWGVGRDPSYYCIWSSSHIQPLEAYFVLPGAFCSSSYLLSWSHLILFQICFHIVSGSFFS